ncbi:MAG: hypothetical protein Q8K81_02260 [Sulfuricurvum sp.]|nr:hypothetical protein [Sulfuricurvum sp.]
MESNVSNPVNTPDPGRESTKNFTSEHNTSLPDNSSAKHWNIDIDSFQDYWSQKIRIFSSNLDQKLFTYYDEEENVSTFDTNVTKQCIVDSKAPNIPLCYLTKIKKEEDKETYQTSIWLDEFFKDETYLDATNKSYVRVRGGYEYNKRGDPDLFYNITARIKLPKTQGKLQLYIGDDTKEHANLSNAQNGTTDKGVGLKYVAPSFFERFNTSASVGVSGIGNPYAKARIEYPLFLGSWLLKPAQYCKLSRKNEFEEWTDLSFDRKLADNEMIRFLLQRSTHSTEPGMSYLSQLSYMNTLKDEIGFNHYIGISGRTQDLIGSVYNSGTTPQEGVYEYSIGTIWRQKLFRNYLFYQMQPIVSFHEQYDYKPNYIFRVSLDFYFGNN